MPSSKNKQKKKKDAKKKSKATPKPELKPPKSSIANELLDATDSPQNFFKLEQELQAEPHYIPSKEEISNPDFSHPSLLVHGADILNFLHPYFDIVREVFSWDGWTSCHRTISIGIQNLPKTFPTGQ
eukprot:TRINITY_DN14783_c0_g1_i1.p2 TRINITY_DN14783_c0_g1~~TRINITY_DN14783_c0_g1_i1.p2  ORF type:complete len:127 (-),score=20.92 TRINITY_DN14783_c0_g1_i1:427-807(-)